MEFNLNTRILIVGLGLIGGSYAQALSDKGYEVGAIDCNTSSIGYALENGLIKHGRDFDDTEYISQFDFIIFALYPKAFVKWIKKNCQYIKKNALLTDVTGVKNGVVDEIQAILRSDLEFIAAHPMAGRELSGVENSCKDIFTDANYIVTPTEKNSENAVNICKKLGKELGFKTITTLSPQEHDEMIGFLSQLTHCIAVSLMVCKEAEHLENYTGDSFRDLTRIAKINDEMWSELFLLNKTELLKQMNLFEEKFILLKESIKNDDKEKIRELMRISTKRRKYFDKQH